MAVTVVTGMLIRFSFFSIKFLRVLFCVISKKFFDFQFA